MRLRIDYESIIYATAAKQDQQLDNIANECLRIATGAFKTSPVTSLQVIAHEKSLSARREELTLKYFFQNEGQP